MAALVIATIALAGCSSDDEGEGGERAATSTTDSAPADRRPPGAGRKATPADEKEIRAVLVRLFRSGDVRWVCERALTPRLFRLVYEGPAACRKAAADEEDDEPPGRVQVLDVRTRGDTGTARARLIGGESGGASGGLSLVKRGADWRVDDLWTAFLRSITTASLRNDEDVPAAMGRCIDGRLARIADDRFKRFSYGLLGRRPRASARLLEIWSECERGRDGGSSLRKPLEKAIAEQLRRAKAGPRVVDCVTRRLRSTLPDKLLIRLSTADDAPSKARLNREVLAAAIACGFQPTAPGGGGLSPA